MTVSATLVKELREKTGVGMMDCKKALQETNGNIEEAIKSLREKGLSKAAKKSDRSAKEGRVVTYINQNKAVVLELNCETDFVANNENFISLGNSIAALISGSDDGITADQLNEKTINGQQVSEVISDSVLKLGENIVIGQFKQLSTDGSFADYVHTNGKIGVVVEFTGQVEQAIGKDIAMQVAAMNPGYVSSDQVPTQDLENETNILKQQALAEGKPEQVVDKIVQGRMSKFYKENCLVEQSFVKNPDQQIKDLLPAGVTVAKFERFSLAE